MVIADGPTSAVPHGRRPFPTEVLACPDCGLEQLLPEFDHAQVALCARCERMLAGPATGRIGPPLAFALAAFALLLPAATAPLFLVTDFGAHRQGLLLTSAAALWRDGFPSLGALVALFAVAIPFVYLALLIWVLGSLLLERGAAIGTVFRWTRHLRPWVMIEVFLVGGFVAYSRLKVVANVEVAVGGWCLLAAALALLIGLTQLDERTVWEMLRRQHPTGRGTATLACTVCDLIVHATAEGGACPRCGARLHVRKPDSVRRTLALVIAGFLLYVPANTLPVLTTIRFGYEERNTILSGVIELIRNDLWPLAVIVFVASIVLPLVKLCGLSWMLLATRSHSARALVARTRLYRIIDLVGRWSNIDIFSVSVLVAVLQFGSLTAVHAGQGLVAFAAVVIITMLATTVFDPRLMWDARRVDG
jgi:paraquat-inducible protein A